MLNEYLTSRGERVYIYQLTEEYCQSKADSILKLVNIIPHIKWDKTDLLSQSSDFYHNKWNYSYIVENEEKRVIGVLIAYFRVADEKHIFDSLYIHRLAIDPRYQNIGIGTYLTKYFITKSYREIGWLLNISAQTNDELSNMHVISFYKKIGFRSMYNIKYPDKTDILLLYERKHYSGFGIEVKSVSKGLKHPRLTVIVEGMPDKNKLPVFYFATSNEKKKEIVSFILHNYNIEVSFVKPKVELTEPQVEGPGIEEERKLVSMPLKAISRFITNVPYVVEDTMLFIGFFNRDKEWELPGLDTKRWLRQIKLEGILEIMGNCTNRKARFVSQTGAYLKSNEYFYGRGEIEGTISKKIANIEKPLYGTYPYFFHRIFIPNGANKTLAEMDMYEYAKYDYMRKSFKQLISSIDSIYRDYDLFDYMEETNK
ncbi:MAG: GNAT family N-acetyltransferase [Lachnospiraceae bacterium]|nr:GNAT family N-acetyltransferase [Lachnospiraceae bacterium]